MKGGNIFAVCDKCGEKITKFDTCMEHPKGVFTFGLSCNLCNFQFRYSYATAVAKRKSDMEKANIMLSKRNMTSFVKSIMKNMGEK